jgi:hypothetical protein
MKLISKAITVLLAILSFTFLILSMQLRRDVKVKEEAVELLIYSWSNYIDSIKIETAAYQDTIKSLRMNK